MCKAIGAEHLFKDPLYATGPARSDNRDALNAEIGKITVSKTSADWIEALNAAGVPSGPIYKMNEVFADPQVKHLNITRKVAQKVLGEIEVIGQPIELSRTPWSIRSASPESGEHTDEVLGELGYSGAEIAALHAGKVV
jgi:crotonobetainyl-CoA:carnitine CoA-transferase CaiB-like acyl-CoA transferase